MWQTTNLRDALTYTQKHYWQLLPATTPFNQDLGLGFHSHGLVLLIIRIIFKTGNQGLVRPTWFRGGMAFDSLRRASGPYFTYFALPAEPGITSKDECHQTQDPQSALFIEAGTNTIADTN